MTKKKTTSKKSVKKVPDNPPEELLVEITPENIHGETPAGTVVRKRQSEQSESQSQQSG